MIVQISTEYSLQALNCDDWFSIQANKVISN